MRSVLVLGLLLLTSVPCRAQVTAVEPIFHGLLEILPAGGSFDRETGDATLKVRRWRFIADRNSNGLSPLTEPIEIILGDNVFTIPVGLMTSRNDRVFSFRAPRDADPRLPKRFRMKRRDDGTWAIRFVLRGVKLPKLVTSFPDCFPMGVFVGDDDGFSGVYLTRKSFASPRVQVKRECESNWPWT